MNKTKDNSSSQKVVTEKKQQNKKQKKKNLSDALRKNLLRRKVKEVDSQEE